MKNQVGAVCKSCNTLALPKCSCGLVATKKFEDNNLVLFVDDITMVQLVTLYYATNESGIERLVKYYDLPTIHSSKAIFSKL